METIKVNKDGTFAIPKALKTFFNPSDKLICFVEGDTLIIKRINPPKLSKIAEKAKEKPMPLKEIVKEVHAYRRARNK